MSSAVPPPSEEELLGLLGSGRVEAAYQPIIDLAERQVSGWEALLRIRSAEGEPALSPVDVIGPAAACGQLDEFTRQVVSHAWETMAQLADLTPAPLMVTINMELDQFVPGSDLCEWLTAIAWPDTIAPLLEVTERGGDLWLPEHQEAADALHARGFLIGLDDYGAGAARLSFLHQRDWDLVKIDRVFLGSFGRRERIVVEHLVAMLGQLGIPALVEGVETEEHLDFAHDLGVPFAQGYLLGLPMSAAEVLDQLATNGLDAEHLLAP